MLNDPNHADEKVEAQLAQEEEVGDQSPQLDGKQAPGCKAHVSQSLC